MAVTFSCPECGKVLKSSNPLTPGKKVKCPSCAAIFTPAANKPAAPAVKKPPVADDETIELPKSRPTAPPAKKPAPMEDDFPGFDDDDAPPPRPKAGAKKPLPPVDEDDDFDLEDAPPPKKGIQAKKPAPMLDDEDEDLPPAKPSAVSAKKPLPPPNDFGLDDDDEDMPPPPKGKKGPPVMAKKGKARDDDDDDLDDDDDRPAKKGKGAKAKKKSNALVMIIVLLVVVGGLGAVAAFVWPGFLNAPSPNLGPIVRPTAPPGPGPGPGPVVDEYQEDPLAYVPAEAVAVIGVDAKALRGSKVLAGPYQMFINQFEKETAGAPEVTKLGKELMNSIDKIVIAPLPGPAKGKGPTLSIISFSEPLDIMKVQKLFQAEKVEGKEIYRGMGGTPVFAQPHPKIIVTGEFTPEELEKKLTTIGKAISLESDLKTHVETVQTSLIYLAAGNSKEIKGSLSGIESGMIPGVDPKMISAVQQFKSAALHVNEKAGKLDIHASLILQSEEDAQNLQKGVAGFMALAPGIIDAFSKKDDKGGPPPELFKTIKSVLSTFKSGAENQEAWMSFTVTEADVRVLQATALAYFLGAEGPGPVPMKKLESDGM